MVAPYSQTVQNTAKCPHGFPVGTCPICSGMGGGSKASKNRDKPRVPGEMSYNECLAEWHKIQAKKEAQKNSKLTGLSSAKEISFQHKMSGVFSRINKSFANIVRHLGKVPLVAKTPIKFILNNIAKPVLNFALNSIFSAIKNIYMFFNNATNFISSITEKLATVLGEVKNFAENTVINKAKKALKTLLSFFAESGSDEENEEAEKIKAREVKNILKSLFRIKKFSKKEQNAEDKFAEYL